MVDYSLSKLQRPCYSLIQLLEEMRSHATLTDAIEVKKLAGVALSLHKLLATSNLFPFPDTIGVSTLTATLFNALTTSDFIEISKKCHQTVNLIIQIVHGWFALETSEKLHSWKV